MSDQFLGADPDLRSGGSPGEHVEAFLARLVSNGYVESSVRAKRALLRSFVDWIVRVPRLDLGALDEVAVDQFLEHRVSSRIPGGTRPTLLAFLGYLRSIGSVPRPPVAADLLPASILRREYERFLRHDRNLVPETITNYSRVARDFLGAGVVTDSAGPSGAHPDPDFIRDYLLSRRRELAPATLVLVATALRSFLKFLFLQGETARDLSEALPTVRRWRRSGVPHCLSPQEVERLLASCDPETARGRRDHAILLLLARLGLRSCEIAGLELDDLHWRCGEIVVRGKRQSIDKLPLLADVGASIALYMRLDRPSVFCRNLFIRNLAPRIPLGHDGVGFVVRRALARAGLHPPHRGSHLLRFTLATTMIRRGATMAEIGEVLRHRAAETTEIYAKLDFEALRGVALPWVPAGGDL